MLFCLPRKYRSEDDDYAPRDYSYVGSVSEGTRRKQAEPIHNDPERASVRHRASPDANPAQGEVDTTQPAPGEGRGFDVARRLPRAGEGPARAASIAYPRPRDNTFAQTPTYAPQSALPLQTAEEQARREAVAREPAANFRTRAGEPESRGTAQTFASQAQQRYAGETARRESFPEAYRQEIGRERATQTFAPQSQGGESGVAAQPGDVFLPDGSQYARPAAQEMPEWLRVAQQNNMPFYEDRRRRAPRVEPAPQMPPEPPPTDLLGRPIARRTPNQQPTQLNGIPASAEEYEAAGYPPELIHQQRNAEQAIASDINGHRKRHGAQLAAPPPPRAQAEGYRGEQRTSMPVSASYPPPRAEYARRQAENGEQPSEYRRGYAPRTDFAPGSGLADPYGTPETGGYNPYYAKSNRNRPDAEQDWQAEPAEGEEDEKAKLKIPVLGIAVFVAALLVVGLWILEMSFTSQKANVLAARATAEQKLINNHPYQYRELIEREAAANNLHPAFVAAIVLNESSFNPKAESDVGARGLMQMMPDTAEWVHGKMGLTDEYNFNQMYDPETNVHYACWYLAFLSERFHNDPILVSAAFHAGQNTVQNWLNDSRYSADSQTISLDQMADGPTKTYATRVLKAFATYRRLYYEGGMTASAATGADASAAQTAAQGTTITVQ